MNVCPSLFRLFSIVCLIAIIALQSTEVQAVPAWARRTGLPCASCHVGGTSRLNAAGLDFQLRGHRLPLEEQVRPWQDLMDYTTLSAKVRHNGAGSGRPASLDMQSWGAFSGGPLSSRLSYFAEYSLYERSFTSRTSPGFQDVYLQYTDTPTSDKGYRWVRAGRLYPFAVYAAGAGGRSTLSRPRALSDRLGGFLPDLTRRSFGVSGGYDKGGWRGEGGVVSAEAYDNGTPSLRRGDLFLTMEKNLDGAGSELGVYRYEGWQPGSGIYNDQSRPRFRHSGILGRYVREAFLLGGAYIAGEGKDGAGVKRRPDAFFLETAHDFRRTQNQETTAFLRYDNIRNSFATAGGSGRTQGVVLGVSQRIPNSGRAVLEFGNSFAGPNQRRTIQLDILLMY